MPIVSYTECATALGIESNDPLLLLIHSSVEHLIVNYLRYDPVKSEKIEFYPINRERADTISDQRFDSINGRAILQSTGQVLGDVLVLENRPVWNDSTIEVREQYGAYAGQTAGSFGSGTILTKGTDYWIDCSASDQISTSGILYRIGGDWAHEPGSIKVKYNAGYAPADFGGTGTQKVADIKLATLQAVIWNYKQISLNAKQGFAGMTAGPIASERIGPYSYRTAATAVSEYNFGGALPASVREILQPHRSYAGAF